MVENAIKGEVNYLKAQGLGFKSIEGITVCLRANTHQTMVCFVSSGEEPAMHMMRHLAGYIQIFFNVNDLGDTGQPYTEQKNLGAWLIVLDLGVRRLEEFVQNSARGDAIGQLSVIMSVLKGVMAQYGVEQRVGYEV